MWRRHVQCVDKRWQEASHRYRSLSLRQITSEGLVPLLSLRLSAFRNGLHWAVSFSVLVGIELITPQHRNTHRGQRVQNPNALAVLREHFRQSLVTVGIRPNQRRAIPRSLSSAC